MMAIILSVVISSCSKNDDDTSSSPPSENIMLLEPEDNSTGVDPYNILLEWQPLPGMDESAITYSVDISKNGSTFMSIGNTEETFYEFVISSVQFEETYYWKIIAIDKDGLEVESEVYSFTTRAQTTEEHLIGLWLGSYGYGDSYGTSAYGFLFRPNGTVRVYNSITPLITASDTLDLPENYKADGTYTVNETTVTGTYHWGEVEFNSFEGNVDTEEGFILGTWGNGENVSDSGLFDVEKVEEEDDEDEDEDEDEDGGGDDDDGGDDGDGDDDAKN